MMIQEQDGTFLVGPLDVACILHDVEADTYHAAFFEESPPPGPIQDAREMEVVRLKSKMHHTAGTKDPAEAQAQLDAMLGRLHIPEGNICREPRAWGGEIGVVWWATNWLRTGETFGPQHVGVR